MFFEVLEKDGSLHPVHSKQDSEYLQLRGWKKQEPKPEPVAEVEAEKEPEVIAKKRGRPFKKD